MPESLFEKLYLIYAASKGLQRTFVREINRCVISDYSEDSESRIILECIEALERLGINVPKIFVDIGANDGVRGSNSRMFIHSGWQAVLVDPNPACANILQRKYKSMGSRIAIKSVAISAESTSECSLYLDVNHPLDGGASINREMAESRSINARCVPIRTTTLFDLLREYSYGCHDIGVLSVDTEGHDQIVLESMGDYKPYFIITERGIPYKDRVFSKQAYLRKCGYELFCRRYSNDIYVLSSAYEQLPVIDELRR